jgi:polyphosphate kinase 2 (PPK2 family)
LPEAGQIVIFDRSWYGRVMVERIEGFCSAADWKRAFREINQFERELVDFGTIMFKFWLHIGKDEQLRRFNERSADELKGWKLTSEDWRNRDKGTLTAAVNDMLSRRARSWRPGRLSNPTASGMAGSRCSRRWWKS